MELQQSKVVTRWCANALRRCCSLQCSRVCTLRVHYCPGKEALHRAEQQATSRQAEATRRAEAKKDASVVPGEETLVSALPADCSCYPADTLAGVKRWRSGRAAAAAARGKRERQREEGRRHPERAPATEAISSEKSRAGRNFKRPQRRGRQREMRRLPLDKEKGHKVCHPASPPKAGISISG
jgi:hypothetical protein